LENQGVTENVNNNYKVVEHACGINNEFEFIAN